MGPPANPQKHQQTSSLPRKIEELSSSDQYMDNESDDETESEQDENDKEIDSDHQIRPKTKSQAEKTADFATSMAKILNSHIKTSDRADPILIRAKTSDRVREEETLEYKAKKMLSAQKKKDRDVGHVIDILPTGENNDPETVRKILQTEKKLRKTAQQGVIQLFNAIRASQIKSEVVSKQVKEQGVCGIDQRQDQVVELSKASFLDLIKKGNT
ncbi:Ribosomal RNA-processing protein 15 [Neolecta irregularis DAH-3]|uniref:Ribosomal RNA-processing protein 15 n=1 Tax=Neolecta irregularis (strain DAH-3) TaxID=1198029 RepID=A0A1U7LUN1_NEOID|nr:Ribosomal RNA-processing protein 15 [Neolecta irregularis DAH-3]|eukprot:OLL26354.1 Ribosomal RNA-processing protein 15 [Neolecta irregularis DAH-3]